MTERGGHVPQPWPAPASAHQAAAASGLVSAFGVYVPLHGVDPDAPLQGGYGFCDWTDSGATPHPGIDLNTPGGADTDCGALIVAPCAGVVRKLLPWNGYTQGEGAHSWLELDDPACLAWAGATTWFHVDHQGQFLVVEGQRVAAGEPIGTCDKSGGWSACHAHCEWLKARPAGWTMWPYGWSRAQVEAAYYRPTDWYTQTVAVAASMAGGGTGDVAILNGPQLAAVMTALWGQYALNMDAAIPKAWADQWRAGSWKGRPVSAEQPVPASEDRPGGAFQVFELGCACWMPNYEVSWNG